MAVPVLMPKVGITVESCIIGAWNKNVGDTVLVGEVLFSYETDKAVFDCESTADGTILQIYHGEGDEVAVLTPVCSVGEPGEAPGAGDTPEQGAAAAGGVRAAAQPGAQAAAASGGTKASEAGMAIASEAGMAIASEADMTAAFGEAGVKISPRAKALANRLGIDYSKAVPSGPRGRVIERDIGLLAQAGAARGPGAGAGEPAKPAEARPATDLTDSTPAGERHLTQLQGVQQAASAITGGAGYTDVKMSKIRRVIASGMTKSLSELAQLTHHHSFDATKILALREDFKRSGAQYGLEGVTIGDMILFAVSRVLRDTPDFNAHLIDGGVIRRFRDVNLGVATATERGLMVPTVFNADKMTLKRLSSEVKALAAAARSGSISPDKLGGATFTVSNLGSTGVEMFTPIINPPQVAILGVCGVVTRVRGAGGVSGGIGAYQSIGLSLTYDHRAVDGAPASIFAQKICVALENINLLLAGEQ